LHHKKEDVRKEEWRTIMDDHNQAKLAATRKPLIAHIYAGDFNSLMRIDYDDATWAQIGQIRQQNRWEGSPLKAPTAPNERQQRQQRQQSANSANKAPTARQQRQQSANSANIAPTAPTERQQLKQVPFDI
jgi:hypothetical protein